MMDFLLKNVFYCALLVVGVFFIPDCFISRHITTGVLGTATLVALYIIITGWRVKAIKLTPLLLFIFLFSVFWVSYQFFYTALAWHDWIEYVSFLLLLFIISQWVFDKKYLKQYYFICSFASICMGGWGLFQYFWGGRVYYKLIPITGSFENPSGIAIFIATLLPASLFFIKERGKWSKLWGCFSCLFSYIVVLLSNSRTGLLIVILVSILFFCQNLSFSRWSKKFILLGMILCGVCLFVGLYYWKKDSAEGRILIWLCSLDMFRDHYLFGVGSGKFQAEYMLYQAEYFRQYPYSIFAMLADNVKNPFNEYLKILVEYGLFGFMLFSLCFINLIKIFWYNRNNTMLYPVFGSILGIVVAAFFSYPLNYPGIVIVLVMSVAIVNTYHFVVWEVKDKALMRGVAVGLLLFTFLFSGIVVYYTRSECEWYKIANASLKGETKEMLPRYQKTYGWMKYDGLFLYNYGAELHQVRDYNKSIEILTECSLHFNDLDVQLLLAENYYQLGMYEDAKRHLLIASNMCPVRFIPLYKLMDVHIKTGDIEEAKHYAKILLNKPVKVHSMIVDEIIKSAKLIIEY